MTIPAVSLDDLTWAQMMDAIRERIPGASSQWTLHAPVDPGITLLELYAYLLEQRLFLLDQVPESLVRGVLGLLGVAPPAPAIPAATVLLLRPSLVPVPAAPSAGPPAAVPPALDAVPAGTELFRPAGAGRIVFSTEQRVALLPPEPVRLEIAGADRTADLRISGVTLLDAGAGAGQPPPAELVLTSPAAFDPPADAWLSLLLELDTRAMIRPSWDPLAPSDVPPPARSPGATRTPRTSSSRSPLISWTTAPVTCAAPASSAWPGRTPGAPAPRGTRRRPQAPWSGGCG